MGSARSRRTVGLVVLVAALVLVFLVARGASFPISGHPLAAWPQPPAVGTCQVLDQEGALQTVPCDRTHSMEVTRTWKATETRPDDLAEVCGDAAGDYLGRVGAQPSEVDGWLPDPPHYSAYQWGAPAVDTVGERAWVVCVIAPWRPGDYTGSVHDLSSLEVRPAAFGMCGRPDDPSLIPCDQPHGWEQLGTTTVDLSGTADDAGVAQAAATQTGACQRLAASLIGVADPTYEHRLRIVVDGQLGYLVSVAEPGGPVTVPTGTSTAASSTAGTNGAMSTTSPQESGPVSPPPSSVSQTPSPGDRVTSGPAGTPGTLSVPQSAITGVGKGRAVAQLSCQVLDPREDLVGSLMGWGDRPLPVK